MSSKRVVNILLTLAFVFLPQFASAQTNTFPSSGNAGVGTTTPATALEVRGGAVNSRVTATGTTGANGKFQLYSADITNNPFAEMQLVAPTGAGSEYLRFNIGNSSGSIFSDALTLNRFGNVGIGTATPGGPIDVRDSSGRQILWNMSSQGHSFLNANGGNVHVAGNLYFNGTNWNRINPAAAGGMWWAGSDGTLGVLQAPAGANPVASFNWNFFIGATGNVGIGTASPTNLLHVNSGAAPSSQFRLSANNAGSLSALSHAPDNAALGFDVDWSTGTGWIARHSTIAMLYKLGGKLQVMGWTGATVGSPIPDSTVHTSLDLTTGRFGIGVANPAYKLDVAGPVRSSSGGFVFPDGTVQTTAATGGGGSSQWSNGTNSIHYNAGNVGVGTGDPAEKLEVAGSVYISGANYLRFPHAYGDVNDGKIGNSMFASGLNLVGINNDNTFRKIQLWGQITQNQNDGTNSWAGTNYFSGNVGIGNNSPSTKLQVAGGTRIDGTSGRVYLGTSAVAGSRGLEFIEENATTFSIRHHDPNVAWQNIVINPYAGKVGIGTLTPTETLEVGGNIKASGTIFAKYQDLAEWVPSSEQLSAGTVVVLDTTKSNQVISSGTAYDTRVAGVISAQPGITLGEGGEGKVLVATTGRVRVKVDASRGAIQIGDLLVTSDVLGVAMKSEPVEFAGRKMHMPGTIIGKALEPLAKGKGEILVLLSLQ